MASGNCTIKRCTKCQEEKPATSEFFYRNKYTKDGFYHRCKGCHSKEWKSKHPKTEKVVRASEGYRICPHCLKEFPATLEWFHPNKKSKNGLAWWCRKCTNDSKTRYRKNHPTKPRTEQQKQRRNELTRAREKTDKSKLSKRASNHSYKARKRNAKGNHTAEDINLQFKSQKGLCWHCGKKLDPKNYHVDHLTPLSRGGSNNADNMVISCPRCNLSKHDRFPHEWNGRLI